ncbi:MAG: outer membrane lipoprotein-sorting protein [Myxococcota bacterium]
MHRPALLAFVLALDALAGFGTARATETEDPALRCLRSNLPKKSSVQTVRFVTRDRLGNEAILRARVLGKVFEDGFRRVLSRFYAPDDIRGSALLVIEKSDRNDVFLYSSAMRRTRRVSARAAGSSLFGTDFSYEDFERLQGLRDAGLTERRPDRELDGRSVWVVETRPAEPGESAYERVVTFIDPETCVVLRAESYEAGDRLRKRLSVERAKVYSRGGIWICPETSMRDLRDGTETRLYIEEIEIDPPLSDKRFRQAELDRGRN